MTGRLPRLALAALVVGLAAHNLVMAELWQAGVRGRALDVLAAWKEVLLLSRSPPSLWQRAAPSGRAGGRSSRPRSTRRSSWSTRCCRSTGSTVRATTKGVLYAVRHDLVRSAAYALGRLAVLSRRDRRAARVARRRRGCGALAVGARRRLPRPAPVVARLGRADWFRQQLSLDYGPRSLASAGELGLQHGGREPPAPAARLDLPQPAGDRVPAGRRARSSSRSRHRLGRLEPSPRSSASRACSGRIRAPRRSRSRSGSLLLAAAQRRWLPVVAAAAVVVGLGRLLRRLLRRSARRRTTRRASSPTSARTRRSQAPRAVTPSRRTSRRSRATGATCGSGLRTVVHHPQGFGLGNAGTEAKRTHVDHRRGRVDLHASSVSRRVWPGCSCSRPGAWPSCGGLWSRSAWLFAPFAAVLALGAADRRARRPLARLRRSSRWPAPRCPATPTGAAIAAGSVAPTM